MSTSSAEPFTDAATSAYEDYVRTPKMNVGTFRDRIAEAFLAGAMWARDHLAAQEPTDEEVEAAALSILADEGGWDLNDEDDAFHVHEIQWRDMDEGEMSGRLASARAALSAARRDEETYEETYEEAGDECRGGEEVAVDWVAGQVLHENDHQFHDWDPKIYGEAGR